MTKLTTEQKMALEMAGDSVPCMMALTLDCTSVAQWLVRIDHLGTDCGALVPNPVPLCTTHKTGFVQLPFWSMFTNTPLPKCDCGVELRSGEVTKL